MSQQVVIGGGVAGLLTAILLAKSGKKVTLLERSPHLGGLLASIEVGGETFDFGTHILRETGINAIDDVILDGIDDSWSVLRPLRVGNFFQGRLNTRSQFPYAPDLPMNIYEEGMSEACKLKESSPNTCSSLEDYFLKEFGKTFYNEIFSPLIIKNLGISPKELVPAACNLFAYTRIIPSDAETTKKLKSDPVFDRKFAFESFEEGVSENKNYYPKSGGIGKWINNLEKLANSLGVKIRLNCDITELEVMSGMIKNVVDQKGYSVASENVFLTVPPITIFKPLGIKSPDKAPSFRKVVIENYCISGKLLTDVYYLMINDPLFKTFRITLYPNIGDRKQRLVTISCEILLGENEDHSKMKVTAFEELKAMGIISKSSSIIHHKEIAISKGFPILEHAFFKSIERQKMSIQELAGNIVFLGKASGKNFFMNDVLMEVDEELKNRGFV